MNLCKPYKLTKADVIPEYFYRGYGFKISAIFPIKPSVMTDFFIILNSYVFANPSWGRPCSQNSLPLGSYDDTFGDYLIRLMSNQVSYSFLPITLKVYQLHVVASSTRCLQGLRKSYA